MSYVRGNPYATRGQSQADARRLAWEKQQEENRKKEEENRKQAQETEAQVRKEQDALEKIAAGADLVQLYTGFIYEGPALVKRINKALLKSALKH